MPFEMLVDVYLQFIAWSPFMIQKILEMQKIIYTDMYCANNKP